MIGKLQANEQELFRTRLEDLINSKYELALLEKKVVGLSINNIKNTFKKI
jgi:hypothetical protein